MPKIVSKRTLRRQIKQAVDRDLRSIEAVGEIFPFPIFTTTEIAGINLVAPKPGNIAPEPTFSAEEFTRSDRRNTVLPTSNVVSVSLESSDSEHEEGPIMDQLKLWALEENVTHRAVGKLLHLLHSRIPELPLSTRTLLGTNRETRTTMIPGGEILYLGLEKGLRRKISMGIRSKNLSCRFSIDGIPLFNNSDICFWPILCILNECVEQTPFPVAVFSGVSKPKCLNSYLQQFISELQVIFTRGITVGDVTHVVDKDRCSFILDAPARSFVKAIKGHMGYYSCEKCTARGFYDSHRMTFPDFSASARTDESFELRLQEEHHNEPFITEKSPLEKIGIGMVSQFPLEYMHLVCLGVVRKLLAIWLKGPLLTRLQGSDIQRLNTKLESCAVNIPVEFN
ncbi:unnamed protein product, partial [Allacma fusca]